MNQRISLFSLEDSTRGNPHLTNGPTNAAQTCSAGLKSTTAKLHSPLILK